MCARPQPSGFLCQNAKVLEEEKRSAKPFGQKPYRAYLGILPAVPCQFMHNVAWMHALIMGKADGIKGLAAAAGFAVEICQALFAAVRLRVAAGRQRLFRAFDIKMAFISYFIASVFRADKEDLTLSAEIGPPSELFLSKQR